MDASKDHLSDRALVEGVLRREPWAVTALVERLRCIPRIVAVLNQRLGNGLGPEDLNDLTQDVLALLWPRLGSYNGQASLETWVYGFCLNAVRNAMRRGRRRQSYGELDESLLESPAPVPGNEYDGLRRALDRLEEREVAVIRLKYFDGLTFEEIGTRLSMPTNSAKTIYYRGMRRLEGFLRVGQEEP